VVTASGADPSPGESAGLLERGAGRRVQQASLHGSWEELVRDFDRGRSSGSGDLGAAPEQARPGKATRTEGLAGDAVVQKKSSPQGAPPPRPEADVTSFTDSFATHRPDGTSAPAVQRLAGAGGTQLDADGVQRVAAQGVAGSGGPLPHLAQIQRSFGPDHDVSRVDAHVGGAAADAAAQIGASAYATGSSVAFQQAPDLHTAAHEAAHVVQQQRGVQLQGGVGASGDVYERHADAVADRVVRGESAADLLAAESGVVPTGGSTRGVQRQQPPKDADGGGDAAPPTASGSGIRGNARAWLNAIPNRPILSDADHDLFVKLTGTPHETMKANWDKGGIMTACNGFTGTYSMAIGLGNLGAFTLSTLAAGAFVRPGGGRHPGYGDIVKMSGLHVCVSLDCAGEGGSWEVIEAGQGGKGAGHDILKHNTKTFSGSNVEGWVDIDAWSDPSVRKRAPNAAKLTGLWEVTDGATTWNYTFSSSSNTVTWEQADLPTSAGKGTWDQDASGANIVLTWDSGSTEQWPAAGAGAGKGTGTSTNGSDVTFKKIDQHPQGLRNQLLGDKRWKVENASGKWNYTFSGTDQVKWVDASDPKQSGNGTWTAKDRVITITWQSGTIETWDLPKPPKAFTSTLSVGDPCTVTPRW
jgi:hypothetical protein